MTEAKKLTYVCLYLGYLDALAPFSDAEMGRLTRAMLTYLRSGEEPVFTGNERFMWPMLKDQLDRDQSAFLERCETNRHNGRKGGRPKKANADPKDASEETEGFSEKPKKPKEKEKNNKKENEKNNEKNNKKENEKDNKPEDNTGEYIAAAPPRPRFCKPSVEDIRAYCLEKDYCVDPEAIWDFYESKGWRVGNAPMKDWKAAVRNWMRKENEHGRSKKPAPAEKLVFKSGHCL